MRVGTYLYLWYPSHWDETVTDTPLIGKYSSKDLATIKTQLQQMAEAEIDYAILSWWGKLQVEVHEAMLNVFKVLDEDPIIDVCFIVERNRFYDYAFLKQFFDKPYYVKVDGKPLVVTFEREPLNDDRIFQHYYMNCASGVAFVLPGYDDRLVPGRENPVLPRLWGLTYRFLWWWRKIFCPKNLHIVSWNEYHENTQIEPSERFGDKYLKLTKKLIG